jgi:hypothetical protein
MDLFGSHAGKRITKNPGAFFRREIRTAIDIRQKFFNHPITHRSFFLIDPYLHGSDGYP